LEAQMKRVEIIEPRMGSRQEPDGRAPGMPEDDRLKRLAQRSIVRLARSVLSESLVASRPPAVQAGASAVAMVLEERRCGR
jgi:hypothetical protein